MTTETTTLKKAISLASSGKEIPAIELVRRNPDMAAAISKLHRAPIPPTYDASGNQQQIHPDMNRMRVATTRAAQSVRDNETVMQTLPDIELSCQILVSSILSPTDLNKTELSYSLPDGLLSPHVSGSMVEALKTHFEQVYRINKRLPKMLRNILFAAGSEPVAVIPENSIDDAINGKRTVSLESLSASITRDGRIINLGVLGPVTKAAPSQQRSSTISLEAFDTTVHRRDVAETITLEGWIDQVPLETMITVSDNPDLLKMPLVNLKVREQKIARAVSAGYAMEALNDRSIHKLSDREISGLIFKDPHFGFQPIATLKTQEQLNRKTIGSPLVVHLPPESVIPVHVPGNVEEHIGYWVMLDLDGNPVVRTESTDYYEQLSNRMSSGDSFASTMLNKVKTQMNGFNYTNRSHLETTTRMYGEAIEQDLITRLRNGVYGNGVALAKNDEIYRIMLARALQKQHTQMLFLPVELLTYFAFRYSQDGMGISLLEDMKILSGLRSMMLFSNVMAAVRNSIGRTEVKIKLDEDDPDPDKTIEIIMHEIQKTRHAAFPIGVSNPVDMVDWMGRAGFEFIAEGHPGVPDVKVDFGEKSTNYPKPDTELEESLRKRQIMGFGLSPENVDAGFTADFATSIVNSNLLLAKRVSQYQEQFCKPLSELHRKITMNDSNILKKLREILENNYDDLRSSFKDTVEKALAPKESSDAPNFTPEQIKHYVVTELLNQAVLGLTVSLPAPSTVTVRTQLEAMKDYIEGLDAILDAHIGDFITSDMVGDVAGQIDAQKSMIRAYYIRKWASDNGFMTELAELTAQDEQGKPILNIYEATKKHGSAIALAVTAVVVASQTEKTALNQVLNEATQENGGLEGGQGGSSSSDSDNTDDDQSSTGDTDGLFSLDAPPSANLTPDEAPLEEEDQAPPAPAKADDTKPAADGEVKENKDGE